jgi:hypothetical protein
LESHRHLRYLERVMAKSRKRKLKRPVHHDEPEPVLSGRLLIGAGVLGLMVLFPWPIDAIAAQYKPDEPPKIAMSDWAPGKTVAMKITLITADFDRLGCVLDKEIGGAHCEYKTESERWTAEVPADDNKRDVIQPYSLVPTNQLVLVAGLWAQPEINKRLHEEPWQSISEKKLQRFIAECQVRLVQQQPQVALRWAKDQGWGKQGPAWVGIAESCKIVDG